MRLKQIPFALYTAYPPPIALRKHHMNPTFLNAYSVDTLSLPLYPGMFPREHHEVVFVISGNPIPSHFKEVILMATIQCKPYFHMNLTRRMRAIENGETIL